MTDNNDIVTHLRAEADAHADGDWSDQVIRRRFTEAADEIERLRAEVDLKGYRLDDALDEIDRLRAEVERLGDALRNARTGAALLRCERLEAAGNALIVAIQAEADEACSNVLDSSRLAIEEWHKARQ